MAAPKQKKMISFENLDKKLQEVLKEKYPNGFAGHTQRIDTPKETLNVVTLETKDTIYMVKIKLTDKKRRDDDDDEDEMSDLGIPEVAMDGDKDEFNDDDDGDDSYGDEPVDEGDDDEEED